MAVPRIAGIQHELPDLAALFVYPQNFRCKLTCSGPLYLARSASITSRHASYAMTCGDAAQGAYAQLQRAGIALQQRSLQGSRLDWGGCPSAPQWASQSVAMVDAPAPGTHWQSLACRLLPQHTPHSRTRRTRPRVAVLQLRLTAHWPVARQKIVGSGCPAACPPQSAQCCIGLH